MREVVLVALLGPGGALQCERAMPTRNISEYNLPSSSAI